MRIGIVISTVLAEKLFSPNDRARMSTLGEVTWWPGEHEAGLAEAQLFLRDCEIAVGSWGTAHPGMDGLLAACPQLTSWLHAAGTVKRFFTDEVRARGLTIASCKGAIADCVAEQVIGQAIVGLRGIAENAASNREGIRDTFAGRRVLGASRFGVVGASEVGRKTMALARIFGCEVSCFDPYASAEDLELVGARKVTRLVDLCRECEVISLHTPKLPATIGLVDAACIAAMPDGALFINTSRGECVDQEALTAALVQGRIRACLDVTDPEPLPPEHVLRRLPNVVLTSHIAGPRSTVIGKQIVADLTSLIAGGRPRNLITADMLELIA